MSNQFLIIGLLGVVAMSAALWAIWPDPGRRRDWTLDASEHGCRSLSRSQPSPSVAVADTVAITGALRRWGGAL
ncbi:hypothetical protein [Actinoalloteichus fjordicus]|uniref:hypothetical protein n=1 Tax=Actinoalloteichus fjordicus TaxID=1612552 RepID=UPI0012FAD34D|nr:hypothetical protein [Actinoalloteichus fjordicus]